MRWIAVMLLTGCGRVGFDALASDSGLVLAYDFDGADLLADATGDTVATCTECPSATPHPGFGTAASFDGMNDCLQIGPATAPPAITAAAWFAPAVDKVATVFGKPLDSDATFENTFELYGDGTGIYVGAASGVSGQAASPVGQWHHVAVTFDGAALAFYYDGVQLSTIAGDPLAYTPDLFRIGCDRDLGTELGYFSGAIDEVRLYDRALSADEVRALVTP